MIQRKIIEIEENLCNGCGQCIPNCPEGALQIIDGKARLVSDLFCDGLGACIGHCPEGAISIVEREARAYDEKKVMERIVQQGKSVTRAHLEHLKEHGETEYLQEALDFLEEKGIENPLEEKTSERKLPCGCPGTMEKKIERKPVGRSNEQESALGQWPVQLTLVNPNARYFDNAELLVATDCVPFAYANFHSDFLQGKSVVVGCPKLDDIEHYKKKLTEIIKSNDLKGITLVHMEVPCCFGLKRAVEQAIVDSGKDLYLKQAIISIRGEVKGGE